MAEIKYETWSHGPWRTERANVGDKHPLAVFPNEIKDGLIPWTDADARLIAEAPSMIELLQDITIAARLMLLDERNPAGWGVWMKTARGIFVRARGEE